MFSPSRLIVRTSALAALAIGLIYAPALYAAKDTAPSATPPSAMENAAPAQGAQSALTPAARAEKRAKELHDRLKITPDQEEAWSKVADVMRENQETIHALIKDRHETMGKRTAVEDLQSYEKVANAHAEGIKKLIPVFQALYDSMSDEQKKNADTVFGSFEGHAAKKFMDGKSGGKKE